MSTTSATPVPAGLVTTTCVPSGATETTVPGVPSNVTPVVVSRPVPVRVAVVPPTAGPCVGSIAVIAGATYV